MEHEWLAILAVIALLAGMASAVWIAVDEHKRSQSMWVMNLVWPLVALSGSILVLWIYLQWGRASLPHVSDSTHHHGHHKDSTDTPFPIMVVKGIMHCGSGCTLGDIVAETLAFLFPTIPVYLGWHGVFQEQIFAVWILDLSLAFVIGVAFQYYAIKPMRELSVKSGIIEALKADTLSLTAWQVGMYGFMALTHFWIFPQLLRSELVPMSLEFWFMMQIAMICGFATAYPVNWWLIRVGIKEQM